VKTKETRRENEKSGSGLPWHCCDRIDRCKDEKNHEGEETGRAEREQQNRFLNSAPINRHVEVSL
jgi:hypothetical protein